MIQVVKCQRCGHEWPTKVERPKRCPNQACQSTAWDKPRPLKRVYGEAQRQRLERESRWGNSNLQGSVDHANR